MTAPNPLAEMKTYVKAMLEVTFGDNKDEKQAALELVERFPSILRLMALTVQNSFCFGKPLPQNTRIKIQVESADRQLIAGPQFFRSSGYNYAPCIDRQNYPLRDGTRWELFFAVDANHLLVGESVGSASPTRDIADLIFEIGKDLAYIISIEVMTWVLFYDQKDEIIEFTITIHEKNMTCGFVELACRHICPDYLKRGLCFDGREQRGLGGLVRRAGVQQLPLPVKALIQFLANPYLQRTSATICATLNDKFRSNIQTKTPAVYGDHLGNMCLEYWILPNRALITKPHEDTVDGSVGDGYTVRLGFERDTQEEGRTCKIGLLYYRGAGDDETWVSGAHPVLFFDSIDSSIPEAVRLLEDINARWKDWQPRPQEVQSRLYKF